MINDAKQREQKELYKSVKRDLNEIIFYQNMKLITKAL